MKIIRTSTVPLSLNILLKGQLRFLNQFFEVIGISSRGKDLELVAKREGIRTTPVDMERRIKLNKDFVSLFKLYRRFKKEQPIIVHSITPKAGLLSMLAAKMAGVPIRIHTFTGLIFPTRRGLMKRVLIKSDQILCWAATHIYPEGYGVKNDLIRYHITSKPLKVLANGNVNGLDLDFFSIENISDARKELIRSEVGINKDDFVFIYIGRLVGDKGINELISAFKKIRRVADQKMVSNLHIKNEPKLLLVGAFESSLDPLKLETISEIENNADIINVGFKEDVRPYLAVSDVLAFPSYREGFPNVVMQAGAMGLPCVVTDINGCNEIIRDGVNGLIIRPKDADQLKQAMERLLSDVDLREQLAHNSRRLIVERYDQHIVWRALLKEYREAIEEWSK